MEQCINDDLDLQSAANSIFINFNIHESVSLDIVKLRYNMIDPGQKIESVGTSLHLNRDIPHWRVKCNSHSHAIDTKDVLHDMAKERYESEHLIDSMMWRFKESSTV